MGDDSLIEVGVYVESFNDITEQDIPCGPILQADGLEVHIKKHHPDMLDSISIIPQIIKKPDYIGHNPKEPHSIELVKKISKNLMVCVKLDCEKNYLYVASLYSITDGKLENRVKSGRLKPYK